MKKTMKRTILLMLMCLLLCACGQKAEPVAEVENAVESQVEVSTSEIEKEDSVVEKETISQESVSPEESAEVVAEEVDTVAETTEEETETEVPIVVTKFEEPRTLYAANNVNVRRGPGTDYERVGSLALADAVTVIGQADTGWYCFVLNEEEVYVSDAYLSETKPELPPPAPEQPVQADVAAQQVPAQAAVAPAGVIMVGDSRCVQMQEAVGGGGCSWICENSKEYTWFVEKAIPRFDEYVGNGTKVVINMGVNDPEHYRSYAEVVNAKAAEWAARGAKTYFVSVNPVWENLYTTQEQVDTFNANVPGMLSGVTWIDTSSWLTTNGYRLLDGLHYDEPTYVNIFNLIMGSL